MADENKCYLCDKIFQDLEEHFYDKHTSWKIHKCSLCSEKYNSDVELQKHICQQKLEQFSFEDYKKVSNEKVNRSKTKRTVRENKTKSIHKSQKKQKCKSCGKSFSKAGDLKRHTYTIHEGH